MFEIGLTVQDSDTSLRLAVNEKITIKLESEPGTGFEWIPSDMTVRHFSNIEVDYEPLKFTSPTNAIELTVISLEAQKTGHGEIILYYLQPWNPNGVKKTFKVSYSISA